METNQTKTYPDKTDEDRREAPGIETNDTKASYIEANYIETLLSQIREKRARERVRREVESHLEDQKACYLSDGMTQEEASRKAVADMGSPEEAGAALDRIHRPKPAWGMLAIIAALCAAGVLLQYTILKSSSLLQEGDYFFKNQLQYAVLGFAVLCIIYLLDYTVIAAYCRQLCTGILLFLFLILLQKQMGRSGMYWLNIVRIGGFDFSISVLFYLYVPLYGALLHSYRSCRKQDLWKILLYTVLPVFFSLQSSVPLCLNITLNRTGSPGCSCSPGRFVCHEFKKLPAGPPCVVAESIGRRGRCRICACAYPQHYKQQPAGWPKHRPAGHRLPARLYFRLSAGLYHRPAWHPYSCRPCHACAAVRRKAAAYFPAPEKSAGHDYGTRMQPCIWIAVRRIYFSQPDNFTASRCLFPADFIWRQRNDTYLHPSRTALKHLPL